RRTRAPAIDSVGQIGCTEHTIPGSTANEPGPEVMLARAADSDSGAPCAAHSPRHALPAVDSPRGAAYPCGPATTLLYGRLHDRTGRRVRHGSRTGSYPSIQPVERHRVARRAGIHP